VLIFDPAMAQTAMQKQIDKVYAVQRRSEFGPKRYALLFLPGEYHLDIAVGFYTQVLGLGAAPDAVHISGNVHADASHVNNNATTTFWRAAEGFSVTPAGGTMQWAVSQAVPLRRMHVRGNLVLHQHHGWASGGWMSDTRSSMAISIPALSSNGLHAIVNGEAGLARTGTWSSSASRIHQRATGRDRRIPK